MSTTANGKWETVYEDRTTRPGDRLQGVLFVSEDEAVRLRAQWDQHHAFLRDKGRALLKGIQ